MLMLKHAKKNTALAASNPVFHHYRLSELLRPLLLSEMLERLALSKQSSKRATVGSYVSLYDSKTRERATVLLVNPSDSAPERWKVAITSPAGSALLGMSKGDKLDLRLPTGRIRWQITAVHHSSEYKLSC